jgi:hypothetical protein
MLFFKFLVKVNILAEILKVLPIKKKKAVRFLMPLLSQ